MRSPQRAQIVLDGMRTNHHPASTKLRNVGFTLVELVMVLVVISILAVVGMSLFANKSDYAVYVGKQQILSSALLAQQVALATQNPLTPISFSISQSTDDWTLTVIKGGTTPIEVSSQQVERSGATLSVDGALLSGTKSFVYDRHASLVPRASHVLLLSGSSTATLCLSSSGYAYESTNGACP
ncbi:MAG: prepilin-type N-terminal cleavage/methylation domain-containing protein [Hahellaceae bacterium]|nr:prepilin-type N-terminal cleavage/methylation domain-containing protein [Hahellaceae bacterium]MCP5168587.1 prepilin-type N-terminal cleavage/methylation domain-containing protein [Hahellaceae bacterium]